MAGPFGEDPRGPPWYRLFNNLSRGLCAFVALWAAVGGGVSRDPPRASILFVVIVLFVLSLGEGLWVRHWNSAEARRQDQRTITMSRSTQALAAVVCIFWAAALGQSSQMKDADLYKYSSVTGL